MDPNRHLHFVSDFPHLIKCLRNGFLKTGFQTPDGRVSIIELNHPQHLGSGLDWVKYTIFIFYVFFRLQRNMSSKYGSVTPGPWLWRQCPVFPAAIYFRTHSRKCEWTSHSSSSVTMSCEAYFCMAITFGMSTETVMRRCSSCRWFPLWSKQWRPGAGLMLWGKYKSVIHI